MIGPQLKPEKLRPVMIWIHGGAFMMGSGNGDTDFYGPEYFLDKDIVLVTINYRLDIFGVSTLPCLNVLIAA